MQSNWLALPVGRAQHSLKLPTLPEATILEATAAVKDLGEVQLVALGNDPGVPIGEPKVATTTPEDDDTTEANICQKVIQEIVGGVVGDCGLPGLQPDGQVDEVPAAVGVCRGVQVGGGGKPVGQGESGDCQLLSKLLVVVIIELTICCLVENTVNIYSYNHCALVSII